MQFIAPILYRIQNNQLTLLEENLNSVSEKIDKLSVPVVNILIDKLISEGIRFNNKDAVKLLVRFFTLKYYPDFLETVDVTSILDIPDEEISDKIEEFLLSLIKTPPKNSGMVKYCFILFEVSIEDILVQVLEIPDQSSVDTMINVIDLLGEPELEQLLHFRDLAKEHENFILSNFFSARIAKINIYAKIPDYMYNFLDAEDLPTEDEAKVEIESLLEELSMEEQRIKDNIANMTNQQVTDILTSGIGMEVFDAPRQQEIKKLVLNEVQTLSIEQKKDKIEPFLVNARIDKLVNNMVIFRILGPVNPSPENNYDEDGIYKYCMFTCDIYDYDNDDDQYVDWFEGVCDFCSRKIRRKTHAVRELQMEGGWRGCFCSWKCVNDNYLEKVDKETGIKDLINEFQQQMINIGIQDQLPDDVVYEMEKTEETRANRIKKDGSFLNYIPDDEDVKLLEEIEEEQIEEETKLMEEYENIVEDLPESKYVYDKVKIDQKLVFVPEQITVSVSTVAYNEVITEPNFEQLNKNTYQEKFQA